MTKVTRRRQENFVAFNKDGLFGVEISATTRKTALKQAREIHGRGAKVESRGKRFVTRVRF